MTDEAADATVGAGVDAGSPLVDPPNTVEESSPPEPTAPTAGPPSTLWKDDPDAQIERVFRATLPPYNEALATLFIQPSVVVQGGGVRTTEEKYVTIEPNPAQQYVLGADAIEYAAQLAALRYHEKRGAIEECPPENKGVPWVPPEQVRKKELMDELAELEKAEAIKRRRIR